VASVFSTGPARPLQPWSEPRPTPAAMLTPKDQALLEATLLPALERHYLSLLAHGLRTFQAIAATTAEPTRLPDRVQVEAWADRQPAMADDPSFRDAFLEQLCRLLDPLEAMANRGGGGRSPLELSMGELVAWVSEQADARLNRPASSPPGPGANPPPG